MAAQTIILCFSVSRMTSSPNNSSPKFSNGPPKETILLDGFDFEQWLVYVDPPALELTRDEIIQSYNKTLVQVDISSFSNIIIPYKVQPFKILVFRSRFLSSGKIRGHFR